MEDMMRRALTQHMDYGDEQWWVSSPDDDNVWLPVNQRPEIGMESDVRKLFAGNGRTRPINFATRFLSPVFRNKVLLMEKL